MFVSYGASRLIHTFNGKFMENTLVILIVHALKSLENY